MLAMISVKVLDATDSRPQRVKATFKQAHYTMAMPYGMELEEAANRAAFALLCKLELPYFLGKGGVLPDGRVAFLLDVRP